MSAVSFTQQFLDCLRPLCWAAHISLPGCLLEAGSPRLGVHWRLALAEQLPQVADVFKGYVLQHCQDLKNDVMVMTDSELDRKAPEKFLRRPQLPGELRLSPRERILTPSFRMDTDHITDMPELLFRGIDDMSKSLRNGLRERTELCIAVPGMYLTKKAFLVEFFAYATLFLPDAGEDPINSL